jgi:hypothetical protein
MVSSRITSSSRFWSWAIINDAYDDLKSKSYHRAGYVWFGSYKVYAKWTSNSFETLLNIDNRNFRKETISKTYIVPLDDKRKVAGSKTLQIVHV